MKKRAYKQFMFKVMKLMFYISFIYILFILSASNSQQQEGEKLSTGKSQQQEAEKLSPGESQNNVNENMSTGKAQTEVMENMLIERTSDIVGSHESRNTPVTRTDPPRDIKSVFANEICPGVTLPSKLLPEDTWQPVDKSKSVYVLSAYYVKEKNSVFVMGVRPKDTVSVICQLWRGDDGMAAEQIEESEATEPPYFYYRGYTYTSTVFQCPVSSSTQPTHVSLVKKKCDTPTNVLQIRSATKELPYQRRFTVCLSPFILNFDATLRFVKWVEINKLLGVEKFVVYNYSSSANIARLLEFYTSQGLIEVVQWNSPFVANGLAHSNRPEQLETYGSKVALNDCLFRNKQYSEYISNIDINEFIISRTMDRSLIDMIDNLKGNVAAYYINMAFTQQITQSVKEKPALEALETKTTVHIGLDGNRISKLIIRTSDVDFTLPRHVPQVETFIVPPEQSVLHIHPGIGQSQALGTFIDNVLPKTLIDKVENEVHNVRKSLPNVPIR